MRYFIAANPHLRGINRIAQGIITPKQTSGAPTNGQFKEHVRGNLLIFLLVIILKILRSLDTPGIPTDGQFKKYVRG